MGTPTPRRLRVAYIAPRWDYGDPRRGLSFEETNFRSALEGMGHEVHAYDFMTRHQELGRAAMNQELIRFILEREPDMAVFILFKDEISRETIQSLTDAGVVTFNWFCDDQWRFDDFSRHYAPCFSLVSTTHHESLPRYRRLGVTAVLSQWACNRYAYTPHRRDLRYDVTFVGQCYGERPSLIKRLRKAGLDVRCWGFGWPDGRLEHDDMVEVFGVSRVNLNLSNAWGRRFRRRRSPVEQIKARVFEIPGSGGFLLTQEAANLDLYLEPGRDIGVFAEPAELADRIRYWLEHETEREAAARSGHERVLREHTYDHRFGKIFQAAGLVDA